MFTHSVKVFLYVLIFSALVACGGGNKKTEEIIKDLCSDITLNQYAGNWKGNYNGNGITQDINYNLTGSWTVNANDSGVVTGTTSGVIVNPDGLQVEDFEYAITGQVTEQGEMFLTAKSDTGEVIFEWTVSVDCKDMTLAGTWQNSIEPYAGTVTGQRDTNALPKANAGTNESVLKGATVQLDGSNSSDPDGHAIVYQWSINSKPKGSSAVLSDSTSVNPTFIADLEGEYIVNLIVSDGDLDSEIDAITITVDSQNLAPNKNEDNPLNANIAAPTANAGEDKIVITHSLVTLDGSASSDADDNPMTFQWVLLNKPATSNSVLEGSSLVNPMFTPDVDGVYVVSLVVNDDKFSSDAITVTITAQSPNEPPRAVAGEDQQVDTLTLVNLDGSASSDPENTNLTFNWMIESKPTGSTASLSSDSIVDPNFTPDLAGTYKIKLVVNDGLLDSDISNIIIVAIEKNVEPIANPGSDENIEVGQLIQLDGSGSSDANDDNLTYNWNLLIAPSQSVAVLVDDSTQRPTLVPDIEGEYVISLVVNDGAVDSDPVNITITAIKAVERIIIASGTAILEASTNKINLDVTYSVNPIEFPLGNLGIFDITIENDLLTISDILGNSTIFQRRSGTSGQAIGTWQQPDTFSDFAFQLDFKADNSFLASIVAVERIKLNFMENFTIAGDPFIGSMTMNTDGNFVLDDNPNSSFNEYDNTFQQLNEVLPANGICCSQQQIKYDNFGNMFVMTAGKLVKYDADSTIVASVTVAPGNAFFDIDSEGNVFAVDQETNTENTIYKFDNNLVYISENNIGNTSNFNDGGYDYSVDYLKVDNSNNVAISLDVKDDISAGGNEEGLDAVLVFNNNLEDLAVVGNVDWFFNGPTGIAFDTDNNMYVANRWHANVVVLDNSYNSTGYTNPDNFEGNADGQLYQPTDILISDNKLYVVDSLNFRIGVFATAANSSVYTPPLPKPLVNVNKQAAGTYTYTEISPTKGIIDVTFSNSDFVIGCGPKIGIETIALNLNNDNVMVLDILGVHWHRIDGTTEGIVGTWKASSNNILDLTLIIGADNSISVAGDLICSIVI